MKKCLAILSLLLMLSSAAMAFSHEPTIGIFGKNKDYRDTVWIITGYKPLDGNFKKWKFDFVFDARQTIISSTIARIGGIRIGMEYRRVHRFGFGFYGLGNGVNTNSLEELSPNISSATFYLTYSSIFYERILFFNKKWEISATAHLGKGTISGDYLIDGEGRRRTYPEKTVRPFEISTTTYYNLNWWISAGVGVGYRYMRKTPDEIQPVYNAPVAILRVRIKFGKLTKSIWDHDIKDTY